MLLPAMGIVAEVIPVFSRKKLFGYRTIMYTAVATGVISFFVWAHHQFVAGIDPRMASLFTITTLIISVPIAEMLFVYIATLYGGSITLTTPMLWALSFVAEFLLGGVTGIFLGAAGADIYLHDTYFVLAHFHYTFFPIAIVGAFAGITFWFPKMFGRMMDERLGQIHFWGTIVAFNFIFIPLFITGSAGDHRRIFDYSGFPDLATPALQNLRITATMALICLLAVQPVFFYNFIRSMVRGPIAERESVACEHARVGGPIAAAPRQLRGTAGGLPWSVPVQQPRIGTTTSGRSMCLAIRRRRWRRPAPAAGGRHTRTHRSDQ